MMEQDKSDWFVAKPFRNNAGLYQFPDNHQCYDRYCAPGYLQKNGMKARPSLVRITNGCPDGQFYSLFRQIKVKRDKWNGVDLEIYYNKATVQLGSVGPTAMKDVIGCF
jgi:hypothetical protein